MSERNPAIAPILAMEHDINMVLRLAEVLNLIACTSGMIEPDCLAALSDPLLATGKSLRARFKEAHVAAVGGQQ